MSTTKSTKTTKGDTYGIVRGKHNPGSDGVMKSLSLTLALSQRERGLVDVITLYVGCR